MYCNHPSVNILTALLREHGVRHAVVCPGSRNAPIVHNLDECPDICCHGVTDERSAGFYALGMAQATGEATAVCVTSGSALLNLIPAVAEAAFQHVPLVVISADRPAAWIGQLDGQTMPQPDALGRWVKCAVSLPEMSKTSAGMPQVTGKYDDEVWYTARLVNEVLIATRRGGGGPVHINVPLSEPLFGFDTLQLPDIKAVVCISQSDALTNLDLFLKRWRTAKRPMVVIGQTTPESIDEEVVRSLTRRVVVLHESLAGAAPEDCVAHPEQVLETTGDTPEAKPDIVVYLGGCIVSKKLKQWLRGMSGTEQWRIETDGSMPDTFCHLTGLIEMSPRAFLKALADYEDKEKLETDNDYISLWKETETDVAKKLAAEDLEFSEEAVVRYLEEEIVSHSAEIATHYANSRSVRMANLYARHHVWCNRGLNGIEGSLSTAAGFSLEYKGIVVVVTGDLSFFYDQNALWPEELGGNLRILLLNNGGGKIFRQLPGLSDSRASKTFISGGHQHTARGICEQFDIDYLCTDEWEVACRGVDWLLASDTRRPALLEVLLNP